MAPIGCEKARRRDEAGKGPADWLGRAEGAGLY